jgi:hypothetical protein
MGWLDSMDLDIHEVVEIARRPDQPMSFLQHVSPVTEHNAERAGAGTAARGGLEIDGGEFRHEARR